MSTHRSFSVTLQQVTENYKDVEVEFQELKTQCEQLKSDYLSQQEKCEKKTCMGCKELQQVIASKDNIIQLVASVLTRLNETRNFNILSEAFKILCGEETPILTPPKDVDNVAVKEECSATFTQNIGDVSMRDSPKKDESVSEIEGTPTGRTSPIIKSKINKTRSSPRAIESGVKKKISSSWPSPEKKFLKLSFNALPRTPQPARPSGRMRQARLHLVRGVRPRSLVDLTGDQGLSAARLGGDETRLNVTVKRECDNDTIMPSPTSEFVKPDFSEIFKANATRSSPVKFKRPSDVKIKTEDVTRLTIDSPNTSATVMEESINLLQPFRFANKQSRDKPSEANTTQDNNIVSLSILQRVDKIVKDATRLNNNSPSKRPLAENTNMTNIPRSAADATAATVKLDPGAATVKREPGAASRENVEPKPSGSRRKTPEKQEELYKEPTVRKKAEKLALPGWSCEQCRIFYDELYADNPAMLARLMQACSKHRARRDPARASTPPGYWQPRWDVPSDTDEFNRRNNA